MAKTENVKRGSEGPVQSYRLLPISIAIGCSIGLVSGSLALGVGISVAIGVALEGLVRTRTPRKANAELDKIVKE
ncbi:hypothetical protein [Massilia agri]|uniref:Uncharacterized protein n=1 Tax=Massilia agri TaxID=1886785 RepID=A0ABT2AKU4_9BURK|nr:hypothetical protein [Massilia agri]MCS0596871.1 hypothetical protein [Massilia agri]